MVKLRQLEIFLAIATERHFGKAAEKVGMAQPALSQQLRELEKFLGVSLFDRTNRSVNLSDAGKTILAEAAKCVEHARHVGLLVNNFKRGQAGTLEISFSGSIAYSGVLQTAIGEFRRSHPAVHLNIREMSLSDQLRMLEAGKIDVGFIRPPIKGDSELHLHPLWHEDIVIMLPANHSLASNKVIDLADCRKEAFIIPVQDPDVSFHKHTKDLCSRAGFEPKIISRTRDWVTIASQVALGFGFALGPASLTSIDFPGVEIRLLVDSFSKAEVALAVKFSAKSPVVESFVTEMRTKFGKTDTSSTDSSALT